MKLTEFRKGKLIGGIFAIVFSILHLLHSIFFYKIYVNCYISAVFYNSKEEVEKLTSSYKNLNNIIYFLLLSILLVTIILLFICHKKNGINIIKKNEIKTKLPIATSCILAGTILSVFIGFDGLGLHTVINDTLIFIGGIFLIIS